MINVEQVIQKDEKKARKNITQLYIFPDKYIPYANNPKQMKKWPKKQEFNKCNENLSD
jgi:hypothetical protein